MTKIDYDVMGSGEMSTLADAVIGRIEQMIRNNEQRIDLTQEVAHIIVCEIKDLRTRLSGQTCYVPPEFQAEMDELKRKLAEHQATIKEMEKQVTCDHDWHVQDDSFGHEFGTEIIVYDLCEKCGATKQCDEVDYDDL